jgi:hypothetical protein
MTIEEINKLPMVFIVGMGRSGTTLLRTILDAGEECLFAPEAKVIVHLKQKYNHRKNWSSSLLNEFIEDLYKENAFKDYWGIDRTDLSSKFHLLPLQKITFPLLCKIIYLSYPSDFPKNKIRLLGDKNPVYSVFLPELLEVFPNAKFIHIVRDYRDCILSNKRLFKRQNIFALAQLWKLYNSWIDIYSRKYPNQFYLLRYEDLVADPDKIIHEICVFSGLVFNPKMLDFHQNLNETITNETNILIQHTYPEILKKVNLENIGKWKNELSKEEQKKIAYVLNEYGVKYGYEKNSSYQSEKFPFRSIFGFWVNIKDLFIIKGYFILPFFIRDFISQLARFVFDKTGYFTVYNQGNLIKELANKKIEASKIKK